MSQEERREQKRRENEEGEKVEPETLTKSFSSENEEGEKVEPETLTKGFEKQTKTRVEHSSGEFQLVRIISELKNNSDETKEALEKLTSEIKAERISEENNYGETKKALEKLTSEIETLKRDAGERWNAELQNETKEALEKLTSEIKAERISEKNNYGETKKALEKLTSEIETLKRDADERWNAELQNELAKAIQTSKSQLMKELAAFFFIFVLGVAILITQLNPPTTASSASFNSSLPVAMPLPSTPPRQTPKSMAVVFGPSFFGGACPKLACLKQSSVVSYLSTLLPNITLVNHTKDDVKVLAVAFRQTSRLQLSSWEINQLESANANNRKAIVLSFQNADPENMHACEISGPQNVTVLCLLYDHTPGEYGSFAKQGEKYRHNRQQLLLLQQLVMDHHSAHEW